MRRVRRGRAAGSSAPVIVFAQPAQVSGTRLARRIGAADAALLQRRLLARTLHHLDRGGVRTLVAVPAGAQESVAAGERAGARIILQPHGGAGRRLADVLRHARRGAILVDSDAPGLDAIMVCHAAASLGHFDLIVGPNWSGGAYLIGLRSPHHAFRLFAGVRWGSRHMLEDLLARAPRHWLVGLLPVLADANDPAGAREASEDHAPPRRRSSALGLITMRRR